jgi:hypothetical protein
MFGALPPKQVMLEFLDHEQERTTTAATTISHSLQVFKEARAKSPERLQVADRAGARTSRAVLVVPAHRSAPQGLAEHDAWTW